MCSYTMYADKLCQKIPLESDFLRGSEGVRVTGGRPFFVRFGKTARESCYCYVGKLSTREPTTLFMAIRSTYI